MENFYIGFNKVFLIGYFLIFFLKGEGVLIKEFSFTKDKNNVKKGELK